MKITQQHASKIAEEMLNEADATGHGSWDTIVVVKNGNSYDEADNGDGVDGLSRKAAKDVLVWDILQRND